MAASMTRDELQARAAAAMAYTPGPKRCGRPASWLAAMRFRCVDGHVGGAVLRDVIRCVRCRKPAVLTFPEDTETTERAR